MTGVDCGDYPKFKAPTNPPPWPPEIVEPGFRIRRPPNEDYPYGYWVKEKLNPGHNNWQKVDPRTDKLGPRWDTHVPIPHMHDSVFAMYGLPEDFDGRFLVGKRVDVVCFSENQVVLNFDPDASIIVESSFSFRSKSNAAEITSSVPAMESNLMELLGHKVFAVTVIGRGTLCVSFDNGSIFKCYDDTTQYESYKIMNGESVIIV